MKHIQAACLCQTIHFQLKPGLESEAAIRLVQQEYRDYQKVLQEHQTRYKIMQEKIQPDGSILIQVKKQLQQYNIGSYLD